MKLIARSLVAAVVLSLLGGTLEAQIEKDSVARDFVLEGMKGTPQSLDELIGKKLTVLVFWSTWGKDSNKVLHDLEILYQKYRDKGFQVVGICVDQQVISEARKKVIYDSLHNVGITFPNVYDDHLNTFRSYDVIAVPTTFVLNEKKKVVYKLSGYPLIGRGELETVITEVFEGKRTIVAKKFPKHPPQKEASRFFSMAQMKYDRGNLALAREDVNKALVFDSLWAEPYALLAEICLEENNLADAERLVGRALQCDAQDVFALGINGLLGAKKGDYANAVTILELVASMDSMSSNAYAYLGYALGLSGDESKAAVAFDRAETLSSDNFRTPLLRSEVFRKAGKTKEAVADAMTAKKRRRNR
jgi:alkyl hydroperoxide reductase subunit AhpC